MCIVCGHNQELTKRRSCAVKRGVWTARSNREFGGYGAGPDGALVRPATFATGAFVWALGPPRQRGRGQCGGVGVSRPPRCAIMTVGPAAQTSGCRGLYIHRLLPEVRGGGGHLGHPLAYQTLHGGGLDHTRGLESVSPAPRFVPQSPVTPAPLSAPAGTLNWPDGMCELRCTGAPAEDPGEQQESPEPIRRFYQ